MYVCMYVCIYILYRIPPYIYTHQLADSFPPHTPFQCICTYTHTTHAHSCISTHMHVNTHTHKHAQTHAYTHTSWLTHSRQKRQGFM